MKQQIRINKKVVGIYDTEQNIFSKNTLKSRHLLRKGDAWGIDATVFEELLLPKNATIQVYEKEERITYRADAELWKKEGFYLHFKGNTDHRAQIFLPRKFFVQTQRER